MTRKLFFICVLFFLAIFNICSEIGHISYMYGTIELIRDEDVYDEYDLDIGFPIENLDLISTASDGEIEIILDASETPDVILRITNRTTFYIEINKIEGKDTTLIGLLAGSLTANVEKLTGNKEFEVVTETVTMGVRGTNFNVESSPGGDLLISCDNGEVECTDEEGNNYFAYPGQVVEGLKDEEVKTKNVNVSELEDYRKNWLIERFEVFKLTAGPVIKIYARLYLEFYDKFISAHDALMEKSDIINRWKQEDRIDSLGGLFQRIKDKAVIIVYLLRIRGIMFIFERVYFRLYELEQYYEEGYGKGYTDSEFSADEFFIQFNRQKQDVKNRIAEIRYVTKLYAKRNQGKFPLEEE